MDINPFSIPSIISLLVNFGIGIYIVHKNYRGLMNRVFFLLTSAISIWCFGEFMIRNVQDPVAAFFWAKVTWVGVFFTPAASLHFCLILIKNKGWMMKNIYTQASIYLFGIIFIALHLSTNCFIRGVVEQYWGFTSDRGQFFFVFTIYFMLFGFYGIFKIFKKIKKVENKKQRTQLIYAGTAIGIPIVFGSLFQIILPTFNIDIFPIASITTVIMVVIFAIAIDKYQLLVTTSAVAAETIINTMTESLIIINPDKTISSVNKSMVDLSGYEESESIGKPVDRIIKKKNDEKIFNNATFNKLIKKGSIKNLEAYILTAKGEKILINFSMSAIKDKKGKLIGIVGIAKDMRRIQNFINQLEDKTFELSQEKNNLTKTTNELLEIRTAMLNIMEDMKKTDEKLKIANIKLKNVDEMRKQFVSSTAHELRTPLGIFRWTLEMLLGEDVGKINKAQKELLEQLSQSNNRLIVLVNNLLEISRIDQGRFKMDIKSCNLVDLIEQTLKELAIKINEKKLIVSWKKPIEKTSKIKADRSRIIQVLLNIIGNSVKYTPDNGTIKVKIKEVDELAPSEVIKKYNYKQKHKKYLLCEIADTGMGIPAKEQEKVFSRFFRASNATESEIEGTGLGMAIVKNIIDLHKGAIWFKSEEAKGTTFYFSIPII